jgi:hypothetical protein
MVSGGNTNLKPERANTWSATLDFHPVAISGLRIEVSYFDVKYRDRIVSARILVGQSCTAPITTSVRQAAKAPPIQRFTFGRGRMIATRSARRCRTSALTAGVPNARHNFSALE